MGIIRVFGMAQMSVLWPIQGIIVRKIPNSRRDASSPASALGTGAIDNLSLIIGPCGDAPRSEDHSGYALMLSATESATWRIIYYLT
jgi:hypothetical protein